MSSPKRRIETDVSSKADKRRSISLKGPGMLMVDCLSCLGDEVSVLDLPRR